MRLSDLGREAKATIEYDGAEINVVYRPAAINSDWLKRMGESAGLDTYVPLLTEVLVRWDITDDDGNELEPSVEIMRQLPIDFLNKVAQALLERMSPNR